jgi:hypothetical protein
MNFSTPALIAFCLLALSSCKSKIDTPESAAPPIDSIAPIEADYETEEERPVVHNVVDYSGAVTDSAEIALRTFAPLATVLAAAEKSIHIKDSLEAERHSQELNDPKDSIVFVPFEHKAYQALITYKQGMEAGFSLQEQKQGLLALTRPVGASDSTAEILPKVQSSTLLADGNFFFLGGSPFIERLQPEDNGTYTDPAGKPEVRFSTSITENANYLLTALYRMRKQQVKITFGPPLRSYDYGPQEVNGIGSIIHTFTQRIPVFFLTDKGLVPANLTACEIKVVPEGLGCVSDQPRFEFACAKNLDATDILAIYIPHRTPTLTSCTVDHRSDKLWVADLDNDGIPDIACISGSWISEANGETLSDVLWFVNIRGTWKIIDAGADLDCT